MTINPHIRPDQSVYQTSRDTLLCPPHDIPHDGILIAAGPDRRILWAQLVAYGQVAAQIIKEQA